MVDGLIDGQLYQNDGRHYPSLAYILTIDDQEINTARRVKNYRSTARNDAAVIFTILLSNNSFKTYLINKRIVQIFHRC